MPSEVVVPLVGTEFALASSAAFLVANWPFETQLGKSVVAQIGREEAESLDTKVSAQWIATLTKAGLWRTGDSSFWTEAVLKQRAQLSGVLSLTPAELAGLRIAVRASVAEFSSNWSEFLVVAPGSLESYGVSPRDFVQLLSRLDKLANDGG